MKTMFKKLNLSLLVVLSVSCIAPYTYSAMQPQKPTIDALRTAIRMDNGDRVQALIKAGVDVNAIYSDGETPLLLAINVAVSNGTSDIVLALLDAGANMDIKDKNGVTPERRLISLYAGTDYGTSEAYKNKKILMMRFMLRKP